jgi:hypothetical protein
MSGILFTKNLCSACQDVKKDFDLKALGVKVQQLDGPEALAELAWHELVEEAEKELPLLVIGNQVLKGNALVKKLTKLTEA